MIPDHPIDPQALRRLADHATPGPWEVSGSLVGIGRTKPNIGQTWGPRWRQDIEFIAAAREAIPALLDRIARLEAQTDIRGRAVVIYRERARKAEAAAADIWDEGWAQGMAYVVGMERGTDDDHATTNPYKASED